MLIDIPEEAGIVETSFEDAFVATLDQTLGIAAGVHDRDEVRAQLASRAPDLDRKIFLVVAHHRGQDFRRKLQIGRVEIAADRGRDIR